MSEPCSHDRLIRQITRSTETLAACERTTQSAHALLAEAQLQIERSRALERQLESLNHLHHLGEFWQEPRAPVDSF